MIGFYGVGPWFISVSPPGAFYTPSDVARSIESGGRATHHGVIGFGFPMGTSVSNLDAGRCQFSSFPGEIFGTVDVRFWGCKL